MGKAQVFSPDFIIATVIFLLILTILQVHTQNMYDKIDGQQDLLRYESLVSITDILMLYRGYPAGWNQTNVEVLGLAERPNYLNRTKVEYMMSISDNRIKELMDIEGSSFNITVSNKTDVIYTKGVSDWDNAESIFIVNRNGIMEGVPVTLRLIVW